MTVEQLEELAGGANPALMGLDYDEVITSLARRVLAAEKLVTAANTLVGHDGWGTVNYTDNAMWKDGDLLKAAITAYREASK